MQSLKVKLFAAQSHPFKLFSTSVFLSRTLDLQIESSIVVRSPFNISDTLRFTVSDVLWYLSDDSEER